TTTTSSTAAAANVRTMRVRNVSPPSSGSVALGRPIRVDLPAARTITGITDESYRIRAHERKRSADSVSALRCPDGNARPGVCGGVEAGSVLGLPEVRTPLLVDISSAQ